MKTPNVVRNYYVLPCCLLLLNLGTTLVSYKTKELGDPFVRTAAIMAMVLFGGSLVGFVIEPAIIRLIAWMHRSSRRSGGELGGVLFLGLLGIGVFWLYYRAYIFGPEAILPREWWNGK